MARLRILTDRWTGENYYRHIITGVEFQRTAGAIVWPFKENPGCVLAIGETRSKQAVIGQTRHDIHKLEEFQSFDTSELTEKLALMNDDWRVHEWASPLCDKRVYLLEDINADRRKARRPLLRYGDPLGFSGKGEGLLMFYHGLVQRRTMSEKTLFIGDGACADELARLEFEDANTSVLEFPSAAAICFAVAAIDLNARREWRNNRIDSDAYGPADDLGGY